MCVRATQRIPCAPATTGAARGWVDDQLGEMYGNLGAGGQDIALVISELVTNCLQAGAHTVNLTLLGHHGIVRVEAADDAPGWPKMSAIPHLDQVHGRGLHIVDAVTSAWGRASQAGRQNRVGRTRRSRSCAPPLRMHLTAPAVPRVRLTGQNAGYDSLPNCLTPCSRR